MAERALIVLVFHKNLKGIDRDALVFDDESQAVDFLLDHYGPDGPYFLHTVISTDGHTARVIDLTPMMREAA